MLKRRKTSFLLLLILLIGLLLRGLNPTYGSPTVYISNDEAVAHLTALNMLAARTPVSLANYTPLGAYVQLPFLVASFLLMQLLGLTSGLKDFGGFLLTHEGYFLFIPRLVSTLFGTLTIIAIFKLAKKIYNDRSIALIAAFLSAISFSLVHISHVGRPWAAAMFFLVAVLYFSIGKRFWLALMSAFLSYGFHQIGIFAFALIILFMKPSLKQLIYLFLTALASIFVLGHLTASTNLVASIRDGQSFLRSPSFLTDLISGSPNFNSLKLTVINNFFLNFSMSLLLTDGVIIIFGIIGLLKGLSSSVNKKIAVFVLAYFIFASFFFELVTRYLLPIVLMLIIPASAQIYMLGQKLGKLRIPVLTFIFFLAIINSIWWNYLLFKEATFTDASNWVSNHIASNVAIAYTGGRYMVFVPNMKAVAYTQTVNPNYFVKSTDIISFQKEDTVRNIIYLKEFGGKTKYDKLVNAAKGYPVTFVIDYYFKPQDSLFKQAPGKFEMVKHISPVWYNQEIEVPEYYFDAGYSFDPYKFNLKTSMYSLNKPGPYFDILKVKNY